MLSSMTLSLSVLRKTFSLYIVYHAKIKTLEVQSLVSPAFSFTSQPSLKKHRALHHPSMESGDVSVPSTNGSTAEAVDDEKLVASQL